MTESWGFPCSTKPQKARSLQFTASWRLRGRSGWTDPCASSLERLRFPSFQSTGTRISFAPSLALRGRHSAARHRRHHGQGHQTRSSSSQQQQQPAAPFFKRWSPRRLVPSTSTRAVPAASATLQAAYSQSSCSDCLRFLAVQGIPRRTAKSSEARASTPQPPHLVYDSISPAVQHACSCSFSCPKCLKLSKSGASNARMHPGPYFPRIFPERVPEEEAGQSGSMSSAVGTISVRHKEHEIFKFSLATL